MPLELFLAKVLESQALTYDIREKTVLIGRARKKRHAVPEPTVRKMQNERIVTGKVTDASGKPLQGVTVGVKGTTLLTITDAEGNYRMVLQGTENILTYSMVGFGTTERTIGDSSVINVAMQVSISDLDEIVVIGYGQVNKSDLTGSVG